MNTLKADKYRRVTLPGIDPLTVFEYKTSENGINLKPVKVVEADAPLVKLVRRPDGSYRFPDNRKPTREMICATIKADRDSR